MEIELLTKIKTVILYPIATLLGALALFYFLLGVYQAIRQADNPKMREQAGKHIVYGALGLFIMVSFAGILNLICNTIDC